MASSLVEESHKGLFELPADVELSVLLQLVSVERLGINSHHPGPSLLFWGNLSWCLVPVGSSTAESI